MVTEFWQYENYNTEKKILITFILNTFNCIKIDTIYTLSYGSETVILETFDFVEYLLLTNVTL